MKAIEVTISGDYRNSKNEIVDFENVKGIVPLITAGIAEMHIRGRYAVQWIRAAEDKDGKKLYPERVDALRLVHISQKKAVKHKFSFIGKDIKTLTYEEIQDVASAYDLRGIPLPKELSGASLAQMREKTFEEYHKLVHGKKPMDKTKPLILKDFDIKLSEDAQIDEEAALQNVFNES